MRSSSPGARAQPRANHALLTHRGSPAESLGGRFEGSPTPSAPCREVRPGRPHSIVPGRPRTGFPPPSKRAAPDRRHPAGTRLGSGVRHRSCVSFLEVCLVCATSKPSCGRSTEHGGVADSLVEHLAATSQPSAVSTTLLQHLWQLQRSSYRRVVVPTGNSVDRAP